MESSQFVRLIVPIHGTISSNIYKFYQGPIKEFYLRPMLNYFAAGAIIPFLFPMSCTVHYSGPLSPMKLLEQTGIGFLPAARRTWNQAVQIKQSTDPCDDLVGLAKSQLEKRKTCRS